MPDQTASPLAQDEQDFHDEWTDGRGRRAGEVYYDKLGHRRVVTPPQEFADDGTLKATGADAISALNAMVDAQQASRRAYATYLRTGRRPGVRARAPREARNDRHRGSRRGARAASSSSDDPEPEPPAGRTCEWCGRDISHKNADARHCDTKCRVYANRARDKAEPERVAERDLLNGVPGRAKPCTCTPKGNGVDRGLCLHCGHARGQLTDDWLNDRGPSSYQLVIRDLTRRGWKTGDGKRRAVTRRKVEPRREVAA